MKKGSSLLLTGLSIIIAILLLFHLILNSSFAARLISSKVSALFIGSLHWQIHNISLTKSHVSLQNIQILDNQSDTVISADSLFVKISLSDLLRGDVRILNGFVSKPNVRLITKEDGVLNIVSVFQSVQNKKKNKKNEKASSVNLSKIKITDGYLEYYDSLNIGALVIKDINITGNYNISKTNANLNLRTGDINYCKGDTLRLDSLHLRGKINGAQIDTLSVLISKNEDLINFSGVFKNIYDLKQVSGIYKLEAGINTQNYPFFFNDKWPLKGKVYLNLNQNGTFNNPNAEISLDYKNSNRKNPINNISLKTILKQKKINVNFLKILLNKSVEATTTGIINLEEVFPDGFTGNSLYVNNAKYSINTNIISQKTSNLLSSKTGNRLNKIIGNMKLSGYGVDLDSIKLEGTINAFADFYPLEKIIDKLSVKSKMSLSNKVISIDAKVSSNYAGEGKVNGQFDMHNKSLNADISNLMFDSELLNNFSKIPFVGIYTINGTVRGFLDSLIADVYLNGENVKVDTINIEKAVSVISLNNKDGIVSGRIQANSDVGFGELSFNSKCFKNSTFQFLKDPEIQSRISFDLQDISPIVKNGISGDLKIDGQFTGHINKGIGNFIVSSNVLSHEFINAKNLKTYLFFDGKNVIVDSLIAILPGGKIEASGSLNNFERFTVKSTGCLLLDSLEKVKEYNTFGKLSFDLSSEGDFKTPVAQLKVSVEDPVIVNQKVDSLEFDANLVAGAVDFNICSDFKCYGYYKVNDGKYSIHASLDSTDFMNFILPKDQGLWKGMVSGYSYIKGEGTSIDSMLLDLYNFKLDYDTVNLAKSEALNIYYSGDSVHVKNSNIDLIDNGQIQFSGGFSSSGKGDLNGVFKVPYSATQFFTDDFQEGEGFLEGNVTVYGDIKKPIIKGEFKSDSCSFLYTNTSQKFKNISFNGAFTDTSIIINKSSMNLEAGLINFKGYISSGKRNLDSSNINMNLTFKEVPIDLPEEGEFLLSGDIKVQVNPEIGDASGEIKLLNGIYYKDLDLNLFNRDKPVKKKVVKETEESFLDKIKMDIQLLPYNPITIDNNIAYLNVLPQVKLKGNISKPIVSGRAKVNDGFITFRNREFEIKRGFLDFIDPYSNNPDVDIAADVIIDKWIVTIEIAGNTNEKLSFRLSSVPTLSDREILSLLLIGRPEITGLEDAISVAGDFAGEYLGRTVDKVSTVFSLPVDKVSVSSKDISEGLTVNIEQDVSKYLSTVYSINMKNGDVTRKAELLLKIFDNFSAKGFTETNGKRGFELEAGFEKQ